MLNQIATAFNTKIRSTLIFAKISNKKNRRAALSVVSWRLVTMFLPCFCLTVVEYSSRYRFNSWVTKPTIFLGKLASGKESGFCNFEELSFLHCWYLRKEEVEICILVDDMVMCPALLCENSVPCHLKQTIVLFLLVFICQNT